MCLGIVAPKVTFGQSNSDSIRARELHVSNKPQDHPGRDFQLDIHEKTVIDTLLFEACADVMDIKKISYSSSADSMEIPAYIFQPFNLRSVKSHPVLVWVHGGVHGNVDPVYFPFIREAVEQGYIVIAPEYRGSTGYGKEHYNAIDYGGYEVEDCISAVDYLSENNPYVDTDRIAMFGWSHGGFITLHSVFRESHPFQCGVAIVPVANLILRLSYKGPQYQRYFATQERIRGLPFEKPNIYIERSPVYQVDKLNVPLLVHVATNDEDVDFVETEMLIHALNVKQPDLAETKVYVDPPGGHSFSIQVDSNTLERVDTDEQIDSWNRIWVFLKKNLTKNTANQNE